MPVDPINEELAARTSLTAIQEVKALRQEVTGLRGEIASMRNEIGRTPATSPHRNAARNLRQRFRPVKIIQIFYVVLGLSVVGGGCLYSWFHGAQRRGSAAALVPEKMAASQTVLTLTGSNTLGDQLVPHLVAAFLRAQHADAVEVVKALQTADRFEVRGRLPGNAATTTIQINANGSEYAFRDLGSNKCDIGMSSRRITALEVGQLAKLGNMTSPACEHVIGLDGVAFIVNRKNPVKSLRTDQLVGLLTCGLRNWGQVDGSPAPVKLFRRNDDSGTYKTVRDLLLAGGDICPDADVITDSEELSARVALETNALGFIGLPYVGSNRALAIGDGGAPPLLPNPITVGTEEYVLTRRLYLYTPDQSLNPWVKRFVDFAASEQGQAQVMRDGFIGQNILGLPIDRVPTGAPPRYRELTAAAERLSLDFRFESGSSDIDNKALVDFSRVGSFFQDPARSGKRLLLFGFADATGTRSANCRLAQTRAESVAERLRSSAVPLGATLGFCDDLPVASNSTPEGRNRNRRVEVWVK